MTKPSALDAREKSRAARMAPKPAAPMRMPSHGASESFGPAAPTRMPSHASGESFGPAADRLLRSDRRSPSSGRQAVAALRDEVEYLRRALAEAYRQIAHLENLADMDSLVPAFNRRAFVRQLSRTISFGERYQTVNSVVYIDINGMKEINDALGHSAGDAALTQVVETLKLEVRQSDVVGRLGGDEFGIILVQTDNTTAWRKVADLAEAIDAAPLVWEETVVRLHAAFGVHTIRPGDDAHSALFDADQSMYLAKKNKRRGPTGRRAPVRR